MDRRKGAQASQPCFQFRQHGSCKFGTRCKYSHDASSAAQSRSSTRHRDHGGQLNPPQDRLRAWKRLLNPNPSSSWTPHASTIRNQETGDRFFQLALDLMEGDVGASQETVKLLAQEDGLAFVKDIERYIRESIGRADNQKARLWLGQIRPMFQLLTHTRVADSNVLEQQVATICNFIQGIGCRRMRVLFDFIADLLSIWSTLPVAKDDEYGISACELSLSVLAIMIDCNATNIIDDNYNQIVKRFEHHVEAAKHSPDDFSKLQARKHLQYLWRRLGVGDALAEAETAKKVPVMRAEFVMRKDLPGMLSAEGPRHDNDHADICDIRILPTHEEITSRRNEYLPTTDSSLFHTPGIRGRLDREFRLLREDTVGQLRDAVSIQLDAMRDRNHKQNRGNNSTIRTYAYEGAAVVDVNFDGKNGMDMVIQFRQPATKKSVQQRRDWWGSCRRLQPGGLVCIISEDGSVLFCVVADTTMIAHEQKRGNIAQDEDEESSRKPSLANDNVFAYVHLCLAEIRQNDIRQVLRWFQWVGPTQHRCLVEFPGVLLPSFQHTLMALQRMSKKSDVPFDDLLASTEQTITLDATEVDPPQYSTKPGFSLNLGCLTNGNPVLRHSPGKPLDPELLSKHSTLDLTQSSALLHTLSRKLALIQGPPGTGKSYTGEKLIKVLLANKTQARLGPILCVCYTNHALDQLLVHLQRDNVNIIRIGSRSKAEELESVNLRVVARNADRTKTEKSFLWEQRNILDDLVTSITDSIKGLESCQSLNSLRNYLYASHRWHHDAFFGAMVDEEGFETVRHNAGQLLNQWRRSGRQDNSPPRDVDDLRMADLWSMTHTERALLYTYWVREQRDPLIAQIMQEYRTYEKTKAERDKVSRDVDLRCLHDADVVGVTTTGLARNLDLLQKLRCKVMLCEEAGEVLEAHTLTALLPSVEHAILIGDHLQLRPQIANYDLQSTNPGGAQYSLDVSLFERLINPLHNSDPRLPFDTLETQRRMHPSISELIRSTLYPALDDGGAVAGYPEIYGMKRRLFWLHHESPEDQESQLDPITTSRTNIFEVEMTVSLVQHLVRQGSYGPDDIAVITPYLGQLMQLRRAMGNLFEISVGERDLEEIEAIEADKVANDEIVVSAYKKPIKRTLLKSIRLATVDNFQGEEAKVVVISLVRSNNANRCGFLSTSNRINVLLSRAQHSMYLIGNANTYRHVNMWSKVLDILEKSGNVGRELELQCPRHPDTPLLVSKADDFLRVAPEGGCILPCDRRLPCGHSCVNRCHHENIHNAVKCLEPCPRPKKGCQHPCKLVCGAPCAPRCNEQLRGLDITLTCGHKVSSAPCWQAQDPSTIICKERVEKTVPGCGHTVEVFCHTDVTADSYGCAKTCGAPLHCGHNCQSPCYRCKKREGEVIYMNHGICEQKCGRKYTACRHSCTQPCHPGSACPLCPAPCEVRCSHSKCSKKCHEPCTPCAEQICASSCPHAKCTMPCAAPCDWIPCSKRCEKVLVCGHQCPSICGETCPDTKFCQICCSEDIKAVEVDFIMMQQYHEIDLDEDPCIFPDCGHFTTMANMDGIMDMKAHYEMSAEGNPTALANATQPFSMDEVKTCPTCRGSLRNIARYGRIVRRAMLDEATKKFISWSNIEYSKWANILLDAQERASKSTPPRFLAQNTRPPKLVLTKGRLNQLQSIRDWVGGNRYNEMLRLWQDIRTFINQVKAEEQPFQRVGDFVQHAARQRKLGGDFVFDETQIQSKGYLQACSLLLKCDITIVSDFMGLRKDLLNARPKLTLDFSQQIADCRILAEKSRATKHFRQEAEAYVYLAQLFAFSRALVLVEDSSSKATREVSAEELKKQTLDQLAAARELVEKHIEQTKGIMTEIEATEKILSDGVFYNPVSTDEMRAVYTAMAREFSGTGHWYTCVNGHPFTVGECGMPMEQARCPECREAVGGVRHMPAAGVQRADGIDDIARGMDRMGIH